MTTGSNPQAGSPPQPEPVDDLFADPRLVERQTPQIVQTDPAQERALLEQLLQTLRQRKPKLYETVRLGAVALQFGVPEMAHLRQENDGLEPRILQRLLAFSFIENTGDHLRCSAESRDYLIREWLADAPERFRLLNQRLADLYQQRLQAAVQPAEQEQFQNNLLYHTLLVAPNQGARLAEHLLQHAEQDYRPAAAEQVLAVVEAAAPWLSTEYQFLLAYVQVRVAQIHGNWHDGLPRLVTLQDQPDLPAAARARILRAIGRAQLQQQNWLSAIEDFHSALKLFATPAADLSSGERQQEMIQTMTGLGDIYLDFALNSWGGARPIQLQPETWREQVWHWLTLASRLPLVLYLGLALDWRVILPVLADVGKEMDWVVARLVASAIRWYRRAEEAIAAQDAAALAGHQPTTGSGAELPMLEAKLAHLFLAINHPRQASQHLQAALAHPSVVSGSYRQTQIRLDRVEALFRMDEFTAAQAELADVLPRLERFGQHRALAQARLWRARFLARNQDQDHVARAYIQALDAWEDAGDDDALTDCVHEMEELALAQWLGNDGERLIRERLARVSRRVYPVRYLHPLYELFSRGALVLLPVLLFFVLFYGLRTESGTIITADAALIKPVVTGIKADEDFGPSVDLSIDKQIRPTLNSRFVGTVILGTGIGYLLLYTILGLYLIALAPLDHVQRSQQRRWQLDAQAIRHQGDEVLPRSFLGRLGHRFQVAATVTWKEVSTLVLADRIVAQHPLPLLSHFTVVGQDAVLRVDGYTRHYEDLQKRVRGLILGEGLIFDNSFFLFRGVRGRIFLLTVIYLIFFSIMAATNETILVRPLQPLPYSLADFYGLSYLGLAFPIGYWLLIQPLRTRLLEEPRSYYAWVVWLAGVFLAIGAVLQITQFRLPLGRPDVAVGLLAIFLLFYAAYSVYNARLRTVSEEIQYVYSTSVRWTTVAVTGLLIAVTLTTVVRELLSFHHLVVANAALQRAEWQVRQGDADLAAQAPEAYEQARDSYQKALALRSSAAVYNSLGAVYNQLDEFEAAVGAYSEANKRDPDEATYKINLALALNEWAKSLKDGDRQERIDTAKSLLADAIDDMSAEGKRNRVQLATTHILLAGIEYEQKNYAAALASYEAALTIQPGRGDALIGRAWARTWEKDLRRSIREMPAEELPQAREGLALSISDFQEAAAAAETRRQIASAYNGLAWMHFYLAKKYPECDGTATAQTEEFRRHIELAIESFSKAVETIPEAAIYHRTIAQNYYLLRNCQPAYDKIQAFRLAIDSYDRAIAIDPRAGWYFRRGFLYIAVAEVARDREDDVTRQQALLDAEQDLLSAIERDPEVVTYWDTLLTVYRSLGRSEQEWLEAVLEVTGRQDQGVELLVEEAQKAFKGKSYTRALTLFQLAHEHDPNNYDAAYGLGFAAFRTQHYAQAQEALLAASRIDPGAYSPPWLLGWTGFVLREYEEALGYALRFVELAPDDIPPRDELEENEAIEKRCDLALLPARLYARLGDGDSAVQYAQTGLKYCEDDSNLVSLARILQENDENPAAAELAAKALQAAGSAEQFRELALIFQKSGDISLALRAAQLAPDGNQESILVALYNASFDGGFFGEAVDYADEAVFVNPDEPAHHFRLGLALAILGEGEKVSAAYAEGLMAAESLDATDAEAAIADARAALDAAVDAGVLPAEAAAPILNQLDAE